MGSPVSVGLAPNFTFTFHMSAPPLRQVPLTTLLPLHKALPMCLLEIHSFYLSIISLSTGEFLLGGKERVVHLGALPALWLQE